MNTFKEAIDNMNLFFDSNRNVDRKKNEFMNVKEVIDGSFLQKTEFYKLYEYATIEWSIQDSHEDDLRFTGSLRLLPAHEIFKEWEGIVYFKSTATDSRLRLFKPVDLFSDDACAGIFTDDEKLIMHLYNYEGKPESLGLTVDDYVNVALNCRCFYFWQYVVLYCSNSIENEVVRDYVEFSHLYKDVIDIDGLKQILNQKRIV